MRQQVFSFELPEFVMNLNKVTFIESKVNWLNDEGFRVVSCLDLGNKFVFIVESVNTEEEI